MTKFLNNKYLLYAILCVLLVVVALTFSVRSTETASADYIEDIVNNPDAIVNFNQLYSNNYINDTFTANSYKVLNSVSFPIINGHSYYVYITNYRSAIYNYKIWGNSLNTSVVDANNQLNIIFVAQNTFNDCKFEVVTSQGGNNRFYINVIDLSAMFGQNNLPTLAQCKDIFKSDYYAYNTGTPVKFNSLDSYAQGYNDAMSNATIITNSINPATQLFSSNTSYWSPQNNTGAVNYTGRAGLFLGYTAQSGNLLTISYTGLIHENSYLQILYESNGQYIPLIQDLSQYRVGEYSIYHIYETSFSLPVSTQYIYFYASDPNSSGYWGSTLVQLSITNTAYDYQTAVADAQEYGFTQAENMYKAQLDKYQGSNGQGGSAYMDIWNVAYNSGLNAQVSNARKKTYTFSAFLGALFDVPVQTINSLLDFDVLGFNMRNFALSIITISIVFAVVSFIMVKRSS